MGQTVSVVSEDEIVDQILKRARQGEKVRPLAQLLGVSPLIVYEAAEIEGIPLKRGRLPLTPQLYWQHFDEKHGPGAAARFLKMWNRPEPYRPIGKEFGLSGEGARYAGKRLAKGMPKKRPVPKNTRSDLTPQRIQWAAEQCSSTAEVCSLLKASDVTVRKRAREYGINLPKGKGGTSAGFIRRPDITLERVAWHAQHSRSTGELAAKLHCAITTVLRRAKEHRIKLPFDFWKAQRAGVYECISALAKFGFQVPEITKVMRVGGGTTYAHGRSPETKRGNRVSWGGWQPKRRRGVKACAELLAKRGWSVRETAKVVIASRDTIARTIRNSRRPAE